MKFFFNQKYCIFDKYLYFLGNFLKKIIIIAGPCLAESLTLLDEVCSHLSEIIDKTKVDFYFKSSYKKANRTSLNSVSTMGTEKALEWIAITGDKYNVKTLTDIHTQEEAYLASKYVDVIQIPAFLSRQTELLLAAGKTNKIVNIKKAQFMAAEDVLKAADKVYSTGNSNIWLTERGTFFGYHDLVVDYRNLLKMKQSKFPIIYDATHSVQQPSIGETSGGNPQYIESLAYSAIMTGINGIFFETHTEPKIALSDASTQLKLDKVDNFLKNIIKIFEFRDTL